MRPVLHSLFLACLLGGWCRAAEPQWEVRYGQHPDQRTEWAASGYVPNWRIDWSAGEDGQITWMDAEDGRNRGWMLLCRRIVLPKPPPAEVTVSLRYITHCDMGPPRPRSGVFHIVAMDTTTWAELATQPDQATVLDLGRGDTTIRAATVHAQGEDVAEWRLADPMTLRKLPTPDGDGAIMLGVAWGAYHFHCDEHGGFRDLEISMVSEEDVRWRFWEAFDTTTDGLQGLAEAITGRDASRARRILAAYMRSRKKPVVGNPVKPTSPSGIARADEVLHHYYRRLAGRGPYTFDGPIVWNADPFNYNQWAIALNRHFEWLALAGAYLSTGDDRYAKEWADQVLDWVASMPVHIAPGWIQGPFNEPGRRPLSLDAGIRTGQTWFPSFEAMKRSAAVPDAAIVAFVKSCWQHAIYLMKDVNFLPGCNWGTMESNGLYHIGTMLPEFRDASRWRQTAMDRMMGELDYQVYPDGAQVELAPAYHGVSLKNFLLVMYLAQANDAPIPDEYVARLERMYDYYLRIALPDLTVPVLNDSGGRGHIARLFDAARELFPNRPEFVWAATSRKKGTSPSYTSVAMPYAGWVIMRSGWERDAKYLLFDAGPFGAYHQHEDKLHLILYAHGHELLADAGSYGYDTSPWRRYVLSTRGHNTIRVDGKDQCCRRSQDEYRATEPNTHGFLSTAQFDYARDIHTAGYGDPPDKSVTHQRQVLFVKPHYWVVVDTLRANDDNEHRAEVQFLMNAPAAEIETGTRIVVSAAAGADGARLCLVPLVAKDLSVRIAQGETEPEVLGFIPEGWKMRPAPAAIYATNVVGSKTVAFALVPFTGDDPPITAVETSTTPNGLTAHLRLRNGDTHTFEFNEAGIRARCGANEFGTEN